jgi:hypothetical protein
MVGRGNGAAFALTYIISLKKEGCWRERGLHREEEGTALPLQWFIISL